MKNIFCIFKFFTLVFALAFTAVHIATAQVSSLVYFGVDGKLVCTADAKGNKVPDFSGVGYKNSEEDIPVGIPVVMTLNPVAGDNAQNLQSAINAVAAMPIGTNGFRGAILLKKGLYPIGSTVTLSYSGIVLRGEGADAGGTILQATGTTQYNLINIQGSSGVTTAEATLKLVTDSYVPVGTKKVTVASGHTFKVGDWVYFRRTPNQAWIDLLGMAKYSWTASGYIMNYERRIVKVEGNTLYFDAPVVDCVDPLCAQAAVVKFSSGRIQNCGIENMRMISTYTSTEDEAHGWNAVFFSKIINGWARDIEVYYFGYSAVNIGDQATWITVDKCKMLDPMSITTGGRKYSFNVDGQRNLVKNCVTRGGRHDYVTGSQTSGPNVFINSSSTQTHADIGPHHRWSTGLLFDNIVSNGQLNVQNRGNSGSGHGWAGTQTMFWNCTGSQIICQDPPGDHTNWTVGCKATVTNAGNVGDNKTQPLGFVESTGTFVNPKSLFESQLMERLSPANPTGLFASGFSTNSIDLSWTDNATDESGFIVERSKDGLVWDSVATVTATTYSSTGLDSSTKYFFRVKAFNKYGKSISNETYATTLTTGLEAQTKKTGFNANYSKGNVSIDYLIERRSFVVIDLYDFSGKKVKNFFSNNQQSGEYSRSWSTGSLPEGIYFVKVAINNKIKSAKILIYK